jgi:putative PIN family toxin of toxin-antitoxin system
VHARKSARIGVRAVVDANVWVSGILSRSGSCARIVDAFVEGRFTLITSEPLLAEVADVLSRPRIAQRSRFTHTELRDLVAAMRILGEVVPISGERGLCRDPDDDAVIETAISGQADGLVTGDRDLTADPAVGTLLAEAGVRLLTAAQFASELAAVDA